jgi:hypothetical protein
VAEATGEKTEKKSAKGGAKAAAAGAAPKGKTLARKEKKCRMDGCKRPYRAKGYCNVHYKSWRAGELKKTRYKICTKEGCRKPRAPGAGSLCAEHAKGDAAAATPATPAASA